MKGVKSPEDLQWESCNENRSRERERECEILWRRGIETLRGIQERASKKWVLLCFWWFYSESERERMEREEEEKSTTKRSLMERVSEKSRCRSIEIRVIYRNRLK